MTHPTFDNTNRHFGGQQKTERVHSFFRKHPIVLFPAMSITLGMTGVLLTAIGTLLMFEGLWESTLLQLGILFGIVCLMINFHVMFLRLLNYYLEIVIITNYRVIDLKKTLFLHDQKEIVDLHEIQDTKKVQKGLFANFINYGNIVIVLPTMSHPMILMNVPHPEYYLNQINEAKRQYILERRQQKEESPHGSADPDIAPQFLSSLQPAA